MEWMDVLVLEKKMYAKLTEVLDLSEQLAEAVDRQDHVSIRMLLSMRQAPIFQLKEIDSNLRLKESDLEPERAAHYTDLLNGGQPESPEEAPLAEQVSANRRLLQRVLELDQRVSQKMGGERSAYSR